MNHNSARTLTFSQNGSQVADVNTAGIVLFNAILIKVGSVDHIKVSMSMVIGNTTLGSLL